jgi:HEAT repeat protein
MLIHALSDQEFIVRENAIDELGELGQPEAIPYLQPLLNDEHPDVRQAAETAIEVLTS